RAYRVDRRQVEGARHEPVGGRGEGSHRTDLHGVAAERRPEVLARGDRNLFGRSPREELDEPITGDLVAEPRAACAQNAPLPVQIDERRQRQGLLVDALGLAVAALPRAERERLVLQRALAPAIADRAVER